MSMQTMHQYGEGGRLEKTIQFLHVLFAQYTREMADRETNGKRGSEKKRERNQHKRVDQ